MSFFLQKDKDSKDTKKKSVESLCRSPQFLMMEIEYLHRVQSGGARMLLPPLTVFKKKKVRKKRSHPALAVRNETARWKVSS